MKGDFSRRTFDASKHYSAVLVEQGRLLTDADSEEEHRILAHRHEAGMADVVGPSGGPLPGAGFGLSTPDGSQLHIGAGSYYLAGTLLENEAEVAYPAQPDRFDVPWPPPEGRHAIVLEHWRRLVTALDDPSIREVALGGPTTSARERVVWQIGAVGVDGAWVCTDELPPADRTTGRMAARAEPDAGLSSPCLIPPQAGYTGLENQLYRVEVFDSGDPYDLDAAAEVVAVTGFPVGQPNQLTVAALGTLAVGDAVEVYRTGLGSDPLEATFAHVTEVDGGSSTLTLSVGLPAFGPTDGPTLRRVGASIVVSRDNGSVVTTIGAIDGVQVSVHDLGPDDVLGFAVGQLVEISDDRVELEGLPRRLHQIADIDTVRRVVLLRTPAAPLAAVPSGVEPSRHPKLRRWDSASSVRFRPDGSGWIHLENGNQVRFLDGRYRAGDYWTFPARAATVDEASGTIEWPDDGGTPALRSPLGVQRRRCVLGYLDIDAGGAITNLVDCRNLFPPLTAMRTLLYVGGDGQEGSAGDAVGGFLPLPGRLAVRVANGGFPVEGATVRFEIGRGTGRLDGGGPGVGTDVVTDAAGLATVQWDLDLGTEHQRCGARLLAPSGVPIEHQVVRFDATIDRDQGGRRGCCFSVGPGGDYPTVDDALADLLQRGERDLCLCLMVGDHEAQGGELVVELERRATLAIHGCGRGSRLRLLRPWQLAGWRAARFADLDLLVVPDAFWAVTDVADVELSGLRVLGRPPEVGLVRVYGFGRLQVTSCVLQARGADGLLGPRRFFDGLDVLSAPWQVDDEAELQESLVKVALELAGLGAGRRRALVNQLQDRIAQAGDEVSRGEIAAFTRLAAAIAGGRELISQVLTELDLVVRAAAAARPGVCLEIGGRDAGRDVDRPARVSVVIADCLIPGVLSFYGLAAPADVIDSTVLKRLGVLVRDNVQLHGIGGDVHLRDNRFGRLAVGREMVRLLEDLVQNPRPVPAVFESLHLTDNVIDGVVTETVARHTVWTANDLTLDALGINRPPDSFIAHVIGDTAVYTGNRSRLDVAGAAPRILDVARTRAEAANLEVVIA